MLEGILLAAIQAATEFLPVSSSGHLALAANLISEPDLFFFTALHLASLIAVIVFTRKEIAGLLTFKKEYRKLWLYLITGTCPAALAGFLFKESIEKAFSSVLFISCAFIFTGIILFLTKFTKEHSRLNVTNSLIIGIFQVLALFPGVSRSGMTISSGLFLGVEKEKAAKFSFLLFIPLSVGAFIFEAGKDFYFNAKILVSFFTCLFLSFIFLKALFLIISKGKFWIFSVYCFLIGGIFLILR